MRKDTAGLGHCTMRWGVYTALHWLLCMLGACWCAGNAMHAATCRKLAMVLRDVHFADCSHDPPAACQPDETSAVTDIKGTCGAAAPPAVLHQLTGCLQAVQVHASNANVASHGAKLEDPCASSVEADTNALIVCASIKRAWHGNACTPTPAPSR